VARREREAAEAASKREREAAEAVARREREVAEAARRKQEAADAAARKEREVAEAAARRKQEAKARWERAMADYSVIPPVAFELSYVFEPGYPVGFRIGTFGFYTTWNFHIPDWLGYSRIDEDYISDYHYDKNGAVHYSGSTWYDYKDLGDREQKSFGWVLGFSINIIDNILMLPVGVGARHSLEYGLFERHKKEWIPAGKSKDKYEDEFENDWKHEFVYEIGLVLTIKEWFSLLGTFKMANFQNPSFTIGAGLAVPWW
jgi:hypothetical protein